MTQAVARLVPLPDPNNRATREIPIGKAVISIGRSPKNDVVLVDPEVSKAHAELLMRGNAFAINDLGSSNGTYVNGKAVRDRLLNQGDVVEIGGCRFTFELGEAVRRRSSVSIVAPSPIDRTQVLLSNAVAALRPADEISDAALLRQRYERVRTAFTAVGELIEITDIAKLCRRILDAAFGLVGAETGAVMLFEADESLVPWASRGPEGADGDEILISRTIVEQVIRQKEAVLASDALLDSRFKSSQSVILSKMRSLMCVPLINGDNVYGILHVGNSSRAAAFAEGDLELLGGIGAGGGVALANAFMAHRLAEEARTRESLGRFLSPVLVDQVIGNRLDLKRGGVEREVTVMFADIRGFTALTEASKPADVVTLLNEYFDQMAEVVFAHGGLLDKFIGDALMAVWGTPVAGDDDAKRALAAAAEMQEGVASMNEMRRDRGQVAIAIGIGLASGTCVAGAIGARRRMEYTVIGDAVNLASRLAGLARGGQVLCDEVTFARAGSPATASVLPATPVKGKTHPVPVYELTSTGARG
ncbi:MAG: FHA domain-containing protein [Deltaproteobacteria bacterium]|nr:FHA domain-containing protein [Deltaproteobacteria bacterium]